LNIVQTIKREYGDNFTDFEQRVVAIEKRLNTYVKKIDWKKIGKIVVGIGAVATAVAGCIKFYDQIKAFFFH
jgi:hypothetical protein